MGDDGTNTDGWCNFSFRLSGRQMMDWHDGLTDSNQSATERQRYFQPVNDPTSTQPNRAPPQNKTPRPPIHSTIPKHPSVLHPSDPDYFSAGGVQPMTEHYIPSTQSTVLIGCITIPNLILMEPTSTLPSSRRPIDNALGSDSTIRDEASESKFSGRQIR